MKYDLVVFDLDGTTLDTLADLAAACNAALGQGGYPARTLDEVRRFVGCGVARLIELALPEGAPEEARERTLAAFKDYYAQHINDATKPYPSILSLFQALKDAGVHTALNSNKLDSAVQSLCARHFPGLYEAALGERAGTPRKPSPEGVRQLMALFGALPDRTLYVGDSQIDLLTAQNAGVDCAWVSWGFRRREELDGLSVPHTFDRAEDLKKFILEN